MSDQAECRWCRRKLNGKPYYMGQPAYIPGTGERAKVNHYGGFVCSRECDWKAAMELEGTMPGCNNPGSSFCMAYQDRAAFERKWSEA